MDKKITLEYKEDGVVVQRLTGWLEHWILSIYHAMPPEQQEKVRKELEARL